MNTNTSFILNGRAVDLAGAEPTQSLLRWLKSRQQHGTKEGCGDGDCGACTVAMIETDAHGQSQYRAVNSCLLPLGALPGREIVTVEGLAEGERLHPVIGQYKVGYIVSHPLQQFVARVGAQFAAAHRAGETDDGGRATQPHERERAGRMIGRDVGQIARGVGAEIRGETPFARRARGVQIVVARHDADAVRRQPQVFVEQAFHRVELVLEPLGLVRG